MHITSITVTSSRKLPHPDADFASMGSGVEMTAAVAAGEDIDFLAAQLQAQADALVEGHLERILMRRVERIRARIAEQDATRLAKPQHATVVTASNLADKHSVKP